MTSNEIIFKLLKAYLKMITFERRKQDILGKQDKSSIGDLDLHIRKLCGKINSNENYYTLSSCSGRVVLVKNMEKKQPGMFVFRSHEKISFDELKKALDSASEAKETLIFKQEPAILAVCCNTLEEASVLLDKAREKAGWKNSGIMTLKRRIIAELRNTEYISLPIMEKGKILVDDNFLHILVAESNTRLEKTWQRIKALEEEF